MISRKMSEHYHQYQRVSENNDGIVEVCRTCKKKLITKKGKDGRIDNTTYAREHVVDFSQPTGATSKIFKRFYPNAKV